MENTPFVSVRLLVSASMLTVLAACGGGGSGGSDAPPAVPANAPPVLDPIGAQSATEAEALSFTVAATDPDGTTPTLTLTGLPAAAQLNADGTFSWTPTAADVANSPFTATFTAADEVDATLTATEAVEITVTAVAVTADCTVAVTSPVQDSLKAAGTPQEVGIQIDNATLEVAGTFACTPNIPAGWGVKLVVTGEANGSTAEETVTDASFTGNLTSLAKDEYTLTATVVDANGANGLNANGDSAEQVVNSVGLGDYYVAFGDSITRGEGDNEDENGPIDGAIQFELASQDGRTLGGYPALLSDALTQRLGYPHFIFNAGYPGINSDNGLNGSAGTTERPANPSLATVLAEHDTAQRVLIMFGMNDARLGANRIPTPQFKTNMQGMIANAVNAGMEPALAKVNIALGDDINSPELTDPDSGSRSVKIKEQNVAIDELQTANTSVVTPVPDFYSLFYQPGATTQLYETQYRDNLHPNRLGYQSMATRWANQLAPVAP